VPITRDFHENQGIYVFDIALDDRSSYESKDLESLYIAESTHFWFSCRRDKISEFFTQEVSKDARILEIGGGTGYVAENLTKLGYTVEMADIHSNGLSFAKKRGIKTLYQFDLYSPPFLEEFDVICLFDVLEHLNDELEAIKCIKTMLKPGGLIILTVPAHQWLWSRDDAIAGHAKRYTIKLLKEVFDKSNLISGKKRYFFKSILPLLFLRRLLNKDTGLPVKQSESFDMGISPTLNYLLRILTKMEFLIDDFLPNIAGGSILAVAQKLHNNSLEN